VRSFIDATSALTDLSQKTGISTTELQKLKYAAEQNGVSLDQVTTGVTKMGKALVEGKDSTVSALGRMGLSLNDLRQMDPAKAFGLISDAIAKVPNPLERSTIAMDIFGKSGADLLPMMTGNLTETMQAAERLGIVIDEKTVAAGDNLGDTFTALQGVGMGVLGKLLGPMLPALQMVADGMMSAGAVVDFLRDMFDALARVGLMAIKALVDGAVSVGEFAAKVPGLSRVLGDDAKAMQGMRDASTWLGGAIKGLEQGTTAMTTTVTKARAPIGLLTEEQKKAQKAAEDWAKAVQDIVNKALLVTEAKESLQWQQALDKLGGSTKLSAAAFKLFADEAVKLRAAGIPLSADMARLAQIHDLLAKAALNTKAAADEEAAAFSRFNVAAGQYIATLPTAIFQTTSFAGSVQMVSAQASNYQGNMAGVKRSTLDWGVAISDVSRGLGDLGRAFGDNVTGVIVGGIAQMLPFFDKLIVAGQGHRQCRPEDGVGPRRGAVGGGRDGRRHEQRLAGDARARRRDDRRHDRRRDVRHLHGHRREGRVRLLG
jgi:hypothetical protein